MIKYIFFIPFLLFAKNVYHSNNKELLVNRMAIVVKNTNREFSFTNKRFGQYYGLTNAYFNNGWQGGGKKKPNANNVYDFLFIN